MGLLVEYRRLKINKKWRQRNRNNNTRIGLPTNINQIRVGEYTYGMINVLNEGVEHILSIGKFCSVAPEVMFVVDSDHPMKKLSTFPFKHWVMSRNDKDSISRGDVIVDNDVWLGTRSTILSGVHIGQGAVVAAGAVVTSDVPPYAIVGGVPAKVIKYRFEQDVIDYLMTFDYESLTENLIKEHIDELYKSIDDMNLDEIKQMFEWFPKRHKLI